MRSHLTLFLAGCAASAPPQAPPTAGTVDDSSGAVHLTVLDGPPVFIAYRDGDGPWQTPVRDSAGDFALHVRADYRWVVVCTGGAMFDSELGAATVADGATVTVTCGEPPHAPGPARIAVSGQMQQPGWVFLDSSSYSARPSWSFELSAEPGLHDLVAYDDTTVAVRRDQDITDATSLAIDLDREGTTGEPTALTFDNAGDDVVGAFIEWHLAHDTVPVFSLATTVLVPPPSLVSPDDREELEVTTFAGTSARSTARELTVHFHGELPATRYTLSSDLTRFRFPPSARDIAVRWTASQPGSHIELWAMAVAGGPPVQHASLTASWVAATGATAFAFDDDLPCGYDPRWRIDPATSYRRVLRVSETVGPIDYASTLDELVTVPPTSLSR